MKKTYQDSCLIQLKIGEPVREISSKREGILKDMILAPNGRSDDEGHRGLVVILYVLMENGNMLSATSDHFTPVFDTLYSEFYPSVHLSKCR